MNVIICFLYCSSKKKQFCYTFICCWYRRNSILGILRMLCHDVGNPIGMWIRRRKGRILKVSIDHLNIRIPEKRCQNQLLKYSIASKVLTYSGIIVAKSSTASNSLTSTLTKLQSQFWTKDFQIASRRQNLSESFQIN